MKILLTGSAGFIGSSVAMRLLARGDDVLGVDALTDYYDVTLKRARLSRHLGHPSYRHAYVDLCERTAVERLFATYRPDRVVHLAAQPGVRASMDAPHACVSSNVTAFLHVLEGCRHHAVEHLVYASTSSVYGANTRLPYSVRDSAEHPLTLYAATKKANEMMAHSYAHLYGLRCTGLRFFTVYGPWGRPDMAPFLFTEAILRGEPIKVFSAGRHKRDFTYVDDIVEGVVRTLDRPASPSVSWSSADPSPASSAAPFRLYNIGSRSAVPLLRFIEVLEECLGKRADKLLLPGHPADLAATEADVSELVSDVDYCPSTSIEQGVAQLVDWYRGYYRGQLGRSA